MQTPTTKLSPREAQIAGLVAMGKTKMQIAAELKISYHTVVSITRNIHGKLRTNKPVTMALEFRRCCSV